LDNNGDVGKDIIYSQLIKDFDIKNFTVEELLKSYITDFNKFSIGFDNVQKVISDLYQKGYKIGLVSNGKTPFQEHNFYALGLREYFSTIVVSEAIGLRKPDKKIFAYICNQLNCSPSDCIFIGDNPKADIEGAKNFGMKTIFFHPNQILKPPITDESIHHYDDLELAIHRINNSRGFMIE
jgi:putative hydrolase of the HAD superfamily